jgi:hypothetical protein
VKRITNEQLKACFLGWQCRIRQIAVREHGGRPMPGMMPRVLSRKGALLSPGLVMLLIPEEPAESMAFFRFQVLKTEDPRLRREAALRFLGADYFQVPELFTDKMTAVFPARSTTAMEILSAKSVLLEFSQYAQSFRLFAKARRLAAGDARREASLWHNRLFNPDVANDADVLAFAPEWRNAVAEPWPDIATAVKRESV